MLKKLTILFFLVFPFALNAYTWEKFKDPNPSKDNYFGLGILCLPNGNVVISSPGADINGVKDAGAIYLFNGATGELISTLYGSKENDKIGMINPSSGLVALSNGNFVVRSPYWDNDTIVNAGAVTWGSGTIGVSGAVSVENSIVGASKDDKFGYSGIYTLKNGNYIILGNGCDIGGKTDYSAITWCDGTKKTTGTVSAENSLVGFVPMQLSFMIYELENGNYVLSNPYWSENGQSCAGIVTWCDGNKGVTGYASKENSLIGMYENDFLGIDTILVLPNSNYVVNSPYCSVNGKKFAGAVTWCDGSKGLCGTIDSTNSLVGRYASDYVGAGRITLLTNGNYVVNNYNCRIGMNVGAGAITWCDGSKGLTGTVGPANSLVGSSAKSYIGMGGVTALSNGNYVVNTYEMDAGGVLGAGAITWCDGTKPTTEYVSSANSIIGEKAGDLIGKGGITALTNGNYVVCSPYWSDPEIADVGAVTLFDGSKRVTGTVNSSNSMVGSNLGDGVGFHGALALPNGNYVFASEYWDNDTIPNAGAVTWGDGTKGTVGIVSSANSLIGSSENDYLGSRDDSQTKEFETGLFVMPNGNYLVASPGWDKDTVSDAGAVTWGDGSKGSFGIVSQKNSMVGCLTGDKVGNSKIEFLANGNYVFNSTAWALNTIDKWAGAVTWCDGTKPATGIVSPENSLTGAVYNDVVGSGGIHVLSNGNYVVLTNLCSFDYMEAVGAVTICDGNKGTCGEISAENSLFGRAKMDLFGFATVREVPEGSVVVTSGYVNDGAEEYVGAVTWFDHSLKTVGQFDSETSLIGSQYGSGGNISTEVDTVNAIVYASFWGQDEVYFRHYDKPSGIADEVSTNYEIRVFPNPAKDYVSITCDLDINNDLSIEVYDESGKFVRTIANNCIQATNQTLTFNVSDLSAGIYLLKIHTQGNCHTAKLCVID